MGLFSKTKTFTAMSYVDLYTKDIAKKKAKQLVNISTENMKDFNTGFFFWKKEYRARYSEKKLERSGFLPSASGIRVVIDLDKLREYMNPIVDGTISQIYYASARRVSASELGRYHLQRGSIAIENIVDEGNYNWVNHTNHLTIRRGIADSDGYETFHNILFDIVKFATIYEAENVLGIEFGSGEEIGVRIYFGQSDYAMSLNPDVYGGWGGSTKERYTTSMYFDNWFLGMDTISMQYATVSSEPEWMIYIGDATYLPDDVYAVEDMILSAIIPIKEDNVFASAFTGDYSGEVVELTSKDKLLMQRFLKKLGIDAEEGSGLHEGLTEKDDDGEDKIDNAYIMEGLPLDSKRQPLIKAMYESFLYLAGNSRSVSIAINELELTYNFDIDYVIKSGNAPWTYDIDYNGDPIYNLESYTEDDANSASKKAFNDCMDAGAQSGESWLMLTSRCTSAGDNASEDGVSNRQKNNRNLAEPIDRPLRRGEYSSQLVAQQVEDVYDGVNQTQANDSYLILRYQHEDDEYIEIRVDNFLQMVTISGVTYYSMLDSGEKTRSSMTSSKFAPRLIIPLEVLNDLKFNEFIQVHEHSFTMLAYAIKEIKLKWYETILGKILIMIVTAVITGGGSMAGFIQALGTQIIGFIIGMAIQIVATALDSEILSIVAGVALTLLNAYLGNFDFSNLTVQNYLPLASKIVEMSNGMIEMNNAKEDAIREEEEAKQERSEEIKESWKLSLIDTLTSVDTGLSAGKYDSWFDMKLGAGLYNYDQYYAVTENLDARVQSEI